MKKSVFRMPTPVKITGRTSSITNAFVNGIIPVIEPTDDERCRRLEEYESKYSPLKLDFREIVGEELWEKHWNNHKLLLDTMKSCQETSNDIKERISNAISGSKADKPGRIEAQWSRFCGGLLAYISDYHNRFVKTDYEINLSMSQDEIQKTLWSSNSIDDFPDELKEVAVQYYNHEKHVK